MPKIFLVAHFDQETMEDDDHEKLIGVYSTRERAEAVIARLRDKPGFRDFPDWWAIFEDNLDEDGWEEGFITVRPGERPWEDENHD